jgi:hypothetical protein
MKLKKLSKKTKELGYIYLIIIAGTVGIISLFFGLSMCFASPTPKDPKPIIINGPWDAPETNPPFEIED